MWPLFKVVNLIYLLVSSYAWFGSILPYNYVPVAVSAFMIFCFMFGKFEYALTTRTYAIISIIFIYMMYSMATVNISMGLLNLMQYLPGALIFMLAPKYQKDLLDFVSKWLCIILSISLIVFFISKVVPLPHVVFRVPDNDNYLPYDNYFFFLQNEMYDGSTANGALRFGSIFLEPGHLAMICCLLLFANKYELKRQPLLWIPIICLGLSFSLVGYVITFISIALLKIRNIFSMVGVVILIAGSWLFVTDLWNGGDNPANTMIVERLEFDQNKGIKGNNRTTKQTDYFFRQCVNDGTIITGVGYDKDYGNRIRGAGFKIFMLRYGGIATILILTLYLMFIPPKANKRYAYSFFTIVCLLFLQRAYPAWYSWLFFYIAGIGISRDRTLFNSGKNANRVVPDAGKNETMTNQQMSSLTQQRNVVQ